MSGRVRQVLIIIGGAVAFGVAGAVGAAYSAHDVLQTPGHTTLAGPGWLSFGAGVGAIVGIGIASGLAVLVRRHH